MLNKGETIMEAVKVENCPLTHKNITNELNKQVIMKIDDTIKEKEIYIHIQCSNSITLENF